MSTIKMVPVTQLNLDLRNYRTVPQPDESSAIHAMIAIDPNYFWGLAQSLLDDDYQETENIVVIEGAKGKSLVVKEGNRRTAILKLIHGIIPYGQFELPSDLIARIVGVDAQWKKTNRRVPCVIFAESEKVIVDRIVERTHAKGETAGRSKWPSVATARHNRDEKGASEPALDLLEKFLATSKAVSPQQTERWSGDFSLSVLAEAMQKMCPILGLTARQLADEYPKVKDRKTVDKMMMDIGLGQLKFGDLRASDHFAATRYGVKVPASPDSKGPTAASAPSASQSGGAVDRKLKSLSLKDPKGVRREIRGFEPKGKGREKLVLLLDEAGKLRADEHPLSLCFLLRSMFEISAKAYCADHSQNGGPVMTKSDSSDRPLLDVLRDITKHLTKSGTDRAMERRLHGAISELGNKEGLLSVLSLNQLIHHPKFLVRDTDICVLFWQIFPLVQEMSR